MFGFKNGKFAIATLAIIAATNMGTAVAAEKEPVQTQTFAQSNENIRLDNQTTGSIRTCDPASANADIICRITKGNPDAKFPAAPIGHFGI